MMFQKQLSPAPTGMEATGRLVKSSPSKRRKAPPAVQRMGEEVPPRHRCRVGVGDSQKSGSQGAGGWAQKGLAGRLHCSCGMPNSTPDFARSSSLRLTPQGHLPGRFFFFFSDALSVFQIGCDVGVQISLRFLEPLTLSSPDHIKKMRGVTKAITLSDS